MAISKLTGVEVILCEECGNEIFEHVQFGWMHATEAGENCRHKKVV